MLVCLTACGRNTALVPLEFDRTAEAQAVESGTVAQNDRFQLEWNDEEKSAALVDLQHNIVWSANPSGAAEPKYDELGMPIKAHPLMLSAVSVKYIDAQTDHEVSANSNTGAVSNGRVSAEKLPDGMRITYYFDEIRITVPVEYRLRENGMSVTVHTAKLQEGENRLTEISLAPFFCSVENQEKDGYLMLPSGSGSLVYAKLLSANGETYRQELYGTDPMVQMYDSVSNEEPVRMPVFGAKSQDKAVCAIVESGAEATSIEAVVGGASYGYSTVYPTLRVRGYDLLRAKTYTGNTKQTEYYTDDIIDADFTVSYTPLYGESADYVGMADVYRSYLLKTGGLEKREKQANSFSVTINGGFMAAKSFLGIPYHSLETLTTMAQASAMVEELCKETGEQPTVYLKGFGRSGLNIGRLAGGYAINSRLGSVQELNGLAEYCVGAGIDAYFNFDILRFKEGSGGFTKMFHSAKSANGKNYYPTDYYVALRNRLPKTAYALLSRSLLPESMERLLNKTKDWQITGFGFDTLGSTAYSDYSSADFWCKKNMASEVTKLLKTARDSERRVAVSQANAYAAAAADHVFDAPLSSARFDLFDEDIPFYEMVLKGFVPLSSAPLNLSAMPEDMLLAAVEGGCTPTWSLMDHYDNSILDYTSPVLHNGVYDRWKDTIVRTVKELAPYYQAIGGASIVGHRILEGGVRVTTYSNGVTAIVNRGRTEQDTPLGVLKAGSYRIGGLAE